MRGLSLGTAAAAAFVVGVATYWVSDGELWLTLALAVGAATLGWTSSRRVRPYLWRSRGRG